MKRGFLLLVVFLLTIASVSALKVTYDNVLNEALPGEQVSYMLHLENNEDSTLSIKLRSPDLNWLLDQEGNSITLFKGEKKDYKISFKPLSAAKILPGNYAVKLILETPLTSIEKLLTAQVLNYGEVVDSSFSDGVPSIDPKRGMTLRLNVKNLHQVSLNGLNLELNGQQFSFSKKINLNGRESLNLEFPVKVDPDTLKGDYVAKVKITLNGNLMLDKELPYVVKEYQELKEVSVPHTGFLKTGETLTFSNSGNTQVSQNAQRTFGWFSYKFASFNPEPTKVEKTDQGYLVQWDLNVNPQTSTSVSYSVNYRMPIIVLIIIILAGFVWYIIRQRNAVVIVKRVFAMHTEAGSIKVMKVVLNVRNRGGLTANNVRIVDRVPNAIKAPTQHSTYKPSHVKAAPEGTVMVWDFTNLRPGEEKVISYRIEGKIQILGRMHLPPAIVKYVLLGRGVSARSSSVSLQEKK